jgi:hypothetical protein
MEVIRAATQTSFPRHASRFHGVLDGKARHAAEADCAAPADPDSGSGQGDARLAGREHRRLDLAPEQSTVSDPDAPVEFAMGGMRGGRKALAEHWKRQRDEA